MTRRTKQHSQVRPLSPPSVEGDTSGSDHSTSSVDLPIHHQRLKQAAKQGHLDVIRTLMETERLPNDEDEVLAQNALTEAMHWALFYSHGDVVAYMVKQGVVFDSRHVRMATTRPLAWLLPIFLQHGWDINQVMDDSQLSLLAYVNLRNNKHVVHSINDLNREVITDIDLVQWFLDNGADPNLRGRYDLTPLSCAVDRATLPCIQLLFQYGGCCDKGALLAHAAQRKLPDCQDVGKLLLSKGCRLNTITFQDHEVSFNRFQHFGLGTPLDKAVEVNNIPMVKLFIDQGADPLIRNTFGMTPLEHAQQLKREEIVQMLS